CRTPTAKPSKTPPTFLPLAELRMNFALWWTPRRNLCPRQGRALPDRADTFQSLRRNGLLRSTPHSRLNSVTLFQNPLTKRALFPPATLARIFLRPLLAKKAGPVRRQ